MRFHGPAICRIFFAQRIFAFEKMKPSKRRRKPGRNDIDIAETIKKKKTYNPFNELDIITLAAVIIFFSFNFFKITYKEVFRQITRFVFFCFREGNLYDDEGARKNMNFKLAGNFCWVGDYEMEIRVISD